MSDFSLEDLMKSAQSEQNTAGMTEAATTLMKMFTVYLSVGFNEQQALQLTQAYLITVLQISMKK